MMNGWNEALMHLKRGEKATLLIPSHMAYGKRGFTDIIGPDEVLIFDIEIMKIVKGSHDHDHGDHDGHDH